jgi:hypothetical protein
MTASSLVTLDAFKFLDVRAPKPPIDDEPRYVVRRIDLPFPPTSFEQALLEIDEKKVDNYSNSLERVRKTYEQHSQSLNIYSGVFGSIDELRMVLELDGEMSPEALSTTIHEFYTSRKSEAADHEFLLEPLSNIWDEYISENLAYLLSGKADSHYLDRLSELLRIGAAFSYLLREPAHLQSDLRPFIRASIAIPSSVVNTNVLKQAAIKAKRTAPVDVGPRDYQNGLIRELSIAEHVLDELQRALRSSAAEPQSPVVDNSPQQAQGDQVAQMGTANLLVSIDQSNISKVATDVLVAKFGSQISGQKVTNVPIVRVTQALEASVAELSHALFRDATPADILALSNHVLPLKAELKNAGVISDETLNKLPLLANLSPYPTIATDPQLLAKASVRPLGVGDLKVVKQNLQKYAPGEVAHIENILMGQNKERIHSVRQKTEEIVIIETETTTTNEKDLQSTDRFEVSEESSQAAAEKRQNEFGVTASGSYGPVSVSAHTKSTDEATQQESRKQSRSFAKEIVSRSVEKIQQRVREERTRKTSLEIEETNKYGLTATSKSVVGVYRWVEKIYWAQVHVYGKRLMLEFMVPEPAALYIHTESNKPASSAKYTKPEPLNITPAQITRFNYASLAARYSAEVESPPPLVRQSSHSALTNADQQKVASITIPDGRVGWMAMPNGAWLHTGDYALYIFIGNADWVINPSNLSVGWKYLSDNSQGSIPIQLMPHKVSTYNIVGTILSLPSEAAFELWQLQTYKALLSAYRLRESEYEEYEAGRNKTENVVRSRGDQENRYIERRELQRASIEILTLQHFDQFGAISPNTSTGWPEIDFPAAEAQGNYALFFQHSFEWEQMTYVFYPYYWGRQKEWIAKLALQSGDMLFGKFLTAGFARVVVPVRPGHEADVLYFLESGKIWQGGEPPVLGDPTYVSIVDEIKESLDYPDAGQPDGTPPWSFKVPTSLVILDDSGKLPEWDTAKPSPGPYIPSKKTCDGVPYNAAQWKDAKTVADAIRALGYEVPSQGDQETALRSSRPLIRAMQKRFNDLGVAASLGRPLRVDGLVGPCTLRALTLFDAIRADGNWPGP